MLFDNKALFKNTIPNIKNKWLKLEDILYGQKYAFTFNPLSQPETNNKKDIYVWYRSMHDQLKVYADQLDLEFVLYYEQSPSARSHFHGTITTNDLTKFGEFIRQLENICSSEMDTIQDPEIWDTYCLKQSYIWNHFFQKHVLPHPLTIRPPKVKDL